MGIRVDLDIQSASYLWKFLGALPVCCTPAALVNPEAYPVQLLAEAMSKSYPGHQLNWFRISNTPRW
jgi:hypothetical protein